jgi:hypothetical protein
MQLLFKIEEQCYKPACSYIHNATSLPAPIFTMLQACLLLYSQCYKPACSYIHKLGSQYRHKLQGVFVFWRRVLFCVLTPYLFCFDELYFCFDAVFCSVFWRIVFLCFDAVYFYVSTPCIFFVLTQCFVHFWRRIMFCVLTPCIVLCFDSCVLYCFDAMNCSVFWRRVLFTSDAV